MKVGAYIASIMAVIFGCMLDSEPPWVPGIGMLICLIYLLVCCLIHEKRGTL